MSQPTLNAELNRLLEAPGLAKLGPQSRPNTLAPSDLKTQLGPALSGSKLSSRSLALVHGTFLLWHDHLDAAHTIAQEFEDGDGSLLHAIMHRREPDFFNAKYWFRRVGQHACFSEVALQVKTLLNDHPKLREQLIPGGQWDAYSFVDACERADGTSQHSDVHQLQLVQKIEIEAFLKHLLNMSR